MSVRTIQLWVEKGILEAWKTAGGHRRILRSSVDAAMRNRTRGRALGSEISRLRVLIVEDDPVMQTYYGALFELLIADAEITVASDGFEGLVELGKKQPQLMLVDVDMPNMDGITMLNRVREQKLAGNTRIAVATALSADELDARGGIPKDIPVYSKPLSVDALSELIEGLEAVSDADEARGDEL